MSTDLIQTSSRQCNKWISIITNARQHGSFIIDDVIETIYHYSTNPSKRTKEITILTEYRSPSKTSNHTSFTISVYEDVVVTYLVSIATATSMDSIEYSPLDMSEKELVGWITSVQKKIASSAKSNGSPAL